MSTPANVAPADDPASLTALSIDLRSDTVTLPCALMRQAMAEAEVGDDVYGEDPTVARLEAETADLLGKEAGLFVTSGTQGNLVALLCRVGRGDEVLIGDSGHSFLYEGGGLSAFAGAQTHALPVQPDGTLDLEAVAAAVHPSGDLHAPATKLLVLENTKDGRALPLEYLARAAATAAERGLGIHLDGARLFNAALAVEEQPSRLAASSETVTVCLSKGLGAPVGSVLCGSHELVERGRKWRKMLGGGLRQAGVLAAAGLVALARREELGRDHQLARQLAEGLASLPDVKVERCSTNMVYASWPIERRAQELSQRLRRAGIVWPGAWRQGTRWLVRLVTHRDLPEDTVPRVIAALEEESV